MKIKFTFFSCWALLGFCGVSAQEVPEVQMMSLEQVYRLADENSQQLRIDRLNIESANAEIKSARSQRLPDISTSLSVGYLADGLLSDRDFTNWTHIDNPHFMNNFALKAQQVVYSGGAISSSIELASLGKNMSELNMVKNRQEIRFLLTGYYLDLCRLHNQQQVLQENLKLTEQVIENMQSRVNEGTALQNDITRYELQRKGLELQLQKVSDARTIICHQLTTTLHLPENTIIEPDMSLISAIQQRQSEKDWQHEASISNASLQQAALGTHISQQQLRLKRSAMLPKVAIVAENHFDGPITIEIPVLNNNFNYWFVGIGIQYQLSSLFKSNKSVKKAKFDLRSAQEQQVLAAEHINNAVQAAYTNYLTSNVELQTEEKSVQLAQENYNVTANRYSNGLCLLTDMLDASNQKLSADLALVNARINKLYNYFKLKYISNTL